MDVVHPRKSEDSGVKPTVAGERKTLRVTWSGKTGTPSSSLVVVISECRRFGGRSGTVIVVTVDVFRYQSPKEDEGLETTRVR